MFHHWFEHHPANSRHLDLQLIRDTFFKGGYYRVDLSPEVSVLSLNTVAFSNKNDNRS